MLSGVPLSHRPDTHVVTLSIGNSKIKAMFASCCHQTTRSRTLTTSWQKTSSTIIRTKTICHRFRRARIVTQQRRSRSRIRPSSSRLKSKSLRRKWTSSGPWCLDHTRPRLSYGGNTWIRSMTRYKHSSSQNAQWIFTINSEFISTMRSNSFITDSIDFLALTLAFSISFIAYCTPSFSTL